MKRLERYSQSNMEEIIPILKLMKKLHILDKKDKNTLGW